AGDGIVGEVRSHVTKGGAAGAVNEEAIECVACAAAHGGEPTACCQASSGTETGSREGAEAAGIGPIAVGLDAEHKRPDLVVGAHGPAEDKTGCTEIAGRGGGHAIGATACAEREAAVEAEIDAGPIDGGRCSLFPSNGRYFRNQRR